MHILKSVTKNFCGVIFVVLASGCREQLKEAPQIHKDNNEITIISCGDATIECSSLIKKSSLSSSSKNNKKTKLSSSNIQKNKISKKHDVILYDDFLPWGTVVVHQDSDDNNAYIKCLYKAPDSLKSVDAVFAMLSEWYHCIMEQNDWQCEHQYTNEQMLWLIFKNPSDSICQVMFESKKKRGIFSSKMCFAGIFIVQNK